MFFTLGINFYFVNKNFFDEGIEQSWCQFLKRGVFLNQLHKAVNVDGLICLLGDLFRKLLDSPFQTFLLCFVTG